MQVTMWIWPLFKLNAKERVKRFVSNSTGFWYNYFITNIHSQVSFFYPGLDSGWMLSNWQISQSPPVPVQSAFRVTFSLYSSSVEDKIKTQLMLRWSPLPSSTYFYACFWLKAVRHQRLFVGCASSNHLKQRHLLCWFVCNFIHSCVSLFRGMSSVFKPVFVATSLDSVSGICCALDLDSSAYRISY